MKQKHEALLEHFSRIFSEKYIFFLLGNENEKDDLKRK